MKVIIDIDEEDFRIMQHNVAVDNPLCPLGEKETVTKIANGTPLPKWHGRLIDADDIDNHIIGHVDTRGCPTIIEADKEKSEDKE